MPTSLFVKANQEYPFISSTSPITLTDATYTTIVGTSGTAMTLDLPPTSACYEGYKIIVRNSCTAAVAITVSPSGTDSINGSASLAQNTSAVYMCYPTSSTSGIWYQIQ